MSNSDDMLFAQIALNQGYVNRDLINKAFVYQKRLPAPKPLGQILVTKNVMSRAQYEDVQNRVQQRKASGRVPVQQPAVNNVYNSGGYGTMNSGFQQNYQQQGVQTPNRGALPQSAHAPTQLFKDRQPRQTSQQTPRDKSQGVKRVRDTSRTAKKKEEIDIIGRTIGGCLVTKKIGQGGMGSIYLAKHSKLDKKIVVKILPPKAAKKKKSLERFRREAKAAARLEHPSIVQVQDVDKTEDGLNYIIMQYVDGQNLREVIETNGAQTWEESTRIVLDAASALQVAHKNGVIHRDIKAENIMLTKSGDVKVADFGLAKDLESDMKLTADNAFIGTPLYMAPEIGRAKIDGRVDIFSLGITYYFLLTGVQPLKGFKTMEILQAKAHDQIAPPEKHDVELPKPVTRVLSKMLAKNRDARYLNMTDLINDLKALQSGDKIAAGPSILWEDSEPSGLGRNAILIGACVVLVLLIATVVLLMR